LAPHQSVSQAAARPRHSAETGVLSQGCSPFLKWAGGKQWLLPKLRQSIGPIRGRYFEPFLGGGTVFFALQPQSAVLSDANADLIATYEAVQKDATRVAQLLGAFTFSPSCFYRVRAQRPRALAQRAARLIFLNRTCWNGLYRVNARGQFNVPIGTFSTLPDIVGLSRLLKAQRALTTATLSIGDFADTTATAQQGDTVYFDPPYACATRQGFVRYNSVHFSWADQVRLAIHCRALATRGVRVIISNANDPAIRRLYAGFLIERVARRSLVAASSEHRRSVTELLITNLSGVSNGRQI